MSRQSQITLLLLLLAGAGLRFGGLFENTFHSDEALFATWARYIAVLRDPLLKSQLVDKPPLLFYLQALFYPLLGPEMWAARLPSLIASILLIPTTATLAWRLYRNEMTLVLAAGFITFSPMAIQFSASAFIDPVMTTLVVVALILVVDCRMAAEGGGTRLGQLRWQGRPWLAGLFFGLAVSSKYQAWLFLPLIVALAAANHWRRAQWIRWLVGLLTMIALLLIWEMARGGQPWLVTAQLQSYGGLRMAWSWELWQRAEDWAQQWSMVLASPVMGFLVLLAMPLFAALLIDQEDRSTALDRLIVLFVLGYALLHWFIAVPVWDRYILPLLPLVGLVMARFLWRVSAFVWSWVSEKIWPALPVGQLAYILLAGLILLQVPSIASAYRGELAVGAYPAADQGATIIAEVLADAPYGTVLYDHWYSWQWRYHFFDKKVYVSWFPDPAALTHDLAVFASSDTPRYLVAPDTSEARAVLRAVTGAGFDLTERARTNGGGGSGMILYQVIER